LRWGLSGKVQLLLAPIAQRWDPRGDGGWVKQDPSYAYVRIATWGAWGLNGSTGRSVRAGLLSYKSRDVG
jgi:hypothetical protein